MIASIVVFASIFSLQARAAEIPRECASDECIVRLAIPAYPDLAVSAKLTGTVRAELQLDPGGVRDTQISGAANLLKDAVGRAIQDSAFHVDGVRTLSLQFDFVIRGKPIKGSHWTAYALGAHHYEIVSRPRSPIPD